ncbi:hypothetical protein BCR43DRAFT_495570 [Syncephalastrum racemosum]|uniref:Uncharacterized protein n=1 Tax=Syncephalastrum racemosum TaxID=13706 RepID=A0A1X2H6A9_SYNRA|nr:hypothetical protein BCR43DRAFT_495570 [Syncephalastrum racemosum]
MRCRLIGPHRIVDESFQDEGSGKRFILLHTHIAFGVILMLGFKISDQKVKIR